MTICAGHEYDGITEDDGRAALDRFVARAREQAVMDITRPSSYLSFRVGDVGGERRTPYATTYPFLLKKYGRGRPVCHLVGSDGTHPLCGARINDERWDVARVTRQRVCRRCLKLKTSRK